MLFRFQSITQTYYRGVQGAVLVFSVTNQTSFTNLTKWMFQLALHCSGSHNGMPVKVLVGNKMDSEEKREVDGRLAAEFARQHNMLYVETSAKEGKMVDHIFEVLASEVLSGPDLSWELIHNDVNTVNVGIDCLQWKDGYGGGKTEKENFRSKCDGKIC